MYFLARMRTLVLNVVCCCWLMFGGTTNAAIISLTNTGAAGELGDDLEGITSGGPFATGIAGLGISVTSVEADGTGEVLNPNSSSLGVNDGPTGDDTDQFDADSNESVTFRFDQAVVVNNIDFVGFGGAEAFEFDGIAITGSDPNLSGSIFTFTTPYDIAANADFTLRATAGTIGIEAFDVTVTAVPEPSSMVVLGLGTFVVFRQRRKRSTAA